MLFKISDKKVEKSVDLQEKGLTSPKSDKTELDEEIWPFTLSESFKIFGTFTVSLVISAMIIYVCYLDVFGPSRKVLDNKIKISNCVLDISVGWCIPPEYCCEGWHRSNNERCAKNQVCCIGKIKKCKGTFIFNLRKVYNLFLISLG